MKTVAERPGLLVQAAEGSPPWLVCDLEVASVAEIVAMLIAAKRTGCLEVCDPQGTRALFFETGEYTGSSSTHAADRLGEVMWRSGRLAPEQLAIASEHVKSGKLFGRVLIELGFMEPTGLRRALVDQAIQVFEAACLEETGCAVFRADLFPKAPLRFGVATKSLAEGAIVRAREHRELMKKLGSLDRICDVMVPAPSHALDDKSLALLQLVTSARKKELTGRELIVKANLGRIAGARALLTLVETGFIEPRQSAADEQLRIKRLCAAINLVMAALDDSGFGVGDLVREYLDKPPASFEEALSGLSLAQPLDDNTTLQSAQFLTGGLATMISALQAVLDDALLQARDTLPSELTDKVVDRVKALGP